MPPIGGHGVPSGKQLIEASQQVVPGPHNARAQNEAGPASMGGSIASIGGETTSMPTAPSPGGLLRSATLPSEGDGVVDEPQAMSHAVEAHTAMRTNEESPALFMEASYRTDRTDRNSPSGRSPRFAPQCLPPLP